MSIKISYRDDLDIVLIKTSGTYKFDEELGTIENALATMNEHNCKQLLFDHSEAKVVVSPATAINRAKQYAEVGFSRTMKIACVATGDVAELKFFELASSNRGWQTKLFTNTEAALEWLTTGSVNSDETNAQK